jgi:hypothetical protein
VTVNGEPVAAADGHREPLLQLRLNHDGTAEVSGCVSCADPGRIAMLLHQLADTVTANPQGSDG